MSRKYLGGRGAWTAGVLAGVIGVIAACSSSTTTPPAADAGVNCGDGSQLCGSSCTAVARDPENCGSCGKTCAAGEVCSLGACATSCGGGTTKCGSSCADTKTDGTNCGVCGTKCAGGEVCSAGKCATTCGAGATQCGNSCVNAQTDQVNCGSCGTLCQGGEQCVAGKCQISCQAGLTLCTTPQPDGGVSDASADASGDAASEASADAAAVLGSPYCAKLDSDDQNCGGCGIVCASPKACTQGACTNVCIAMTGPAFTTNIVGWASAGMRFKALRNTTITSFTFSNQGVADTVKLTDTSGTALQTLVTPATNTTYTATVSWPVTAGTSYDLISVNGNNGRWVSYSNFPTSNASIEVDAQVSSAQALNTTYWFSFTNITTCP